MPPPGFLGQSSESDRPLSGWEDDFVHSLLTVLSPQELAPLAIAGMQPVGQDAYSIEFSDAHSSGISTLEYSREPG